MRRTWLLPAVGLLIVIAWLTIDGWRVREQIRSRYALPRDRTPDALLQFMRAMDGSVEFQQNVITTSNVDSVCLAVQQAGDALNGLPNKLTTSQQREADYYRIKYKAVRLAAPLAAGTESVEPNQIQSMVTEATEFLTSAQTFGSQEQTILQTTTHALRTIGSNDEHLAFCHWLIDWLANMEGVKAQTTRETMMKVAARLELTDQQLVLKSKTIHGAMFDIQDTQGQVVLIEFWGTRCAPCIRDLPALKRLYNQYHEQGFEVVGICLQSEPERIRRFCAQSQLPWVQLCHDESASMECNHWLAEQFGIEAVPTTLLVNRDGRVVAQGVRPAEIEEWLGKLFSK